MENLLNTLENSKKNGFWNFYENHFQSEHTHPINRGLHVFGTLLGIVFVPSALLSSMPWGIIFFPVIHALPGLVGHRLFERNAQVGDVRVLRKDFSPLWFIAGNHVLTYELTLSGLRSLFRFK